MCTLSSNPSQIKEIKEESEGEINESLDGTNGTKGGASLPALTEISKRRSQRKEPMKTVPGSSRTTPSSADSSPSAYNKCPLCKGTGICATVRKPPQRLGPGYRQLPTPSSAKIVKGQRMMLQPNLPKSESHLSRKGTEVYNAVFDSGDGEYDKEEFHGEGQHIKKYSSTSLQTLSKASKGEVSGSKSEEYFPQSNEVIINIPERLSRARENLKSTNWDVMISGVEICVHVARQDAYVVLPLITSIYRALITCLRAPRVKIVRMSEQAAKEMFQLTKAVSRPEFDGLVSILLLKTADNNKGVRLDAMNALYAMVDNVALQYVCRSLTYQGPQNKNYLVRLSVLQLLERIISMVAPKVLLTQPALKDARKKFLEIVTCLVNDPHLAVRAVAKRIFKSLAAEEEFEEALYADIHCDVIKKLEKQEVIHLPEY